MSLQVSVTKIDQTETWDIDDGTGDPFIGYPYRWSVTFQVLSQPHSSPATPTPYTYNGLDIHEGNWIVFPSQIFALEIISIVNASDSLVTCIVEDVDRFNLFFDQNQAGSGIGATSSNGIYDCFIMELGSDGLPIFQNLSSLVSPYLATEIEGRFRYRNEIRNFVRVNQPDHGFLTNDHITLTADGSFVKSKAATEDVYRTIGRVTSTNIPSNDWFCFKPIGEIITISLPGNKGDLVYIDADGGFTTTKPANAKLAYIKYSDTKAVAVEGDFANSTTAAVASPFGVDVYTFNLSYDANGDLATITGLPSGWSADQISENSDIVITHTTGKTPKFCTMFGASVLVNGERRMRNPTAINELIYNVGTPQKFKVTGLTASKAGTGPNGSAVFNIFF